MFTRDTMGDVETAKRLLSILLDPPTTKSDAARFNADDIGELASRGFITTVVAGVATNVWTVTGKGRIFIDRVLEEAQWQ